jgi:hypothetical protein
MARGRKPGQVKLCSYIEDPLFGGFKIQMDENTFNVIEKQTNKTLGYHSKLSSALKQIAHHKLVSKKFQITLKEFVTEQKQVLGEFEAKFGMD